MNKKPKLKTVQNYRKWNAGKWGLIAGVFACPTVPAAIITAINWNDWFGKASYSLPFGFSCVLVALLTAVLGIIGSDTVLKKKEMKLLWVSVLLILVGASCLFLANLLIEMGKMWIFTGAGLVGSSVCAAVEEKVVQPKVLMYKNLIKKNYLDKGSKHQRAIEEQAEKDAQADAEYLKNNNVRF